MLSPRRVFIVKEKITDTELLEMLAISLFQDGIVHESYIKAIIEREKEYPTGIDIGTHVIAIPHTEFEHVIKTGFAAAVLPNKTVEFTAADDPDERVQPSVVIMMALTPDVEKVEMIQKIFAQLGNYENILTICDINCDRNIVVNRLKQIFNE